MVMGSPNLDKNIGIYALTTKSALETNYCGAKVLLFGNTIPFI